MALVRCQRNAICRLRQRDTSAALVSDRSQSSRLPLGLGEHRPGPGETDGLDPAKRDPMLAHGQV